MGVYREVPKLSTPPFGEEHSTLWHFHGSGRAKLYPLWGTTSALAGTVV